RLQRELSDVWMATRSLVYLGVIERAVGDPAEAARLLAQALENQADGDDRTGMVTTLDLLAELAVDDGRPARAVVLYSAAALLRDEVGVFPLAQIVQAKPPLEALRGALGEDAFAEAWSSGRSLMLDEVVAYALGHHDRGEPQPAGPLST